MKITFITDFLPDLDSKENFSGAEVSVQLLAEALKKKSLKINFTLKSLFGADVIHVHGKNMILPIFLLNLFLKKPLIITVRDYRMICDLGMCLLQSGELWSIKRYFLEEVPFFVKNYRKNYLRAYLTAIICYPQRFLYKFVLNNVSRVICLSHGQEKIYRQFGIKNTQVIYNPMVFSTAKYQKKKQIFFGGRYTLGKGKILLEKIKEKLSTTYPDWKFVMVGKGTIQGQVSLPEYMRMVGESSLALIPSIWPEPFGRAALDAISAGTPVISSNRGGLPEIVEDGKYGYLTEPTNEVFWAAIKKGIKNYKYLEREIVKSRPELIKKFYDKPIEEHVNLYKNLVAK